MPYRPNVGDRLTIDGATYVFTQHPAAPGMPFGQAGRRATVYQLARVGDASLRALKVFTTTFRTPRIAAGASRLSPYAALPGLQVCIRTVLTPERHAELLTGHPDLTYAVLMPWIDGLTWQEVVLDRQPMHRAVCLATARSLARLLAVMEAQGLAHCDLSGPNVLLNLDQPEVMLVDVEDLYASDLPRPEKLPAGSAGYAHRTAPVGLWSADADRFAGAVLIAEMLSWCDARATESAVGEQYFNPEELQRNGPRYRAFSAVLRERWGEPSADLLARAWQSETLGECPRLAEWALLLDRLQEAFAGTAGPIAMAASSVEDRQQQAAADRLLEHALHLLGHHDADRAVAALREAYVLAPDQIGEPFARALLVRGGDKARANDWTAALQDYQEAHRVAPPGGLRDELAIIIAKGPVSGPSRCPACGRSARPEWKSCPYCGTALSPDGGERHPPPVDEIGPAVPNGRMARAKSPGRLFQVAVPVFLLLIILAVGGAHVFGHSSVTAAPVGGLAAASADTATMAETSLFGVGAPLSTMSTLPTMTPSAATMAVPASPPSSTPTALPSAAPTPAPTATPVATATTPPTATSAAPPPPLASARYLQTATRLANGRILVAGGEDNHGALATAELYDPATNTWTPAGRMAAPRFHHTATLLRNGKVLVVGGQDSVTGYLASAELFDPATNTWSPAGNMAVVRSQHTATLLADGQVLVVGGWDGINYLNSAERYDQTSNRWTSAGAMAASRYDHTATLLPDGRVLVAGGFGSGAENSAELFDPNGNKWSDAPAMANGRIGHTATLLANGQVLVVGGISSSLGGSYPATAERYDPKANRWFAAGALADGRVGHTATLLPDGQVLVVAGKDGNGLLATVERYDPTSNTWTAVGQLVRPCWLQAAAVLPNGVLVAGGRDANNALSLVERFDQRSTAWSVAR